MPNQGLKDFYIEEMKDLYSIMLKINWSRRCPSLLGPAHQANRARGLSVAAQVASCEVQGLPDGPYSLVKSKIPTVFIFSSRGIHK
jgi:hypothetical protein